MGVIKRVVRRLVHGLGLEVIDRRYAPMYLPHQNLAQLLEAYGITAVIDVGANVGDYGRDLINAIGFTGRIHSFEPVAETYGQLEKAAVGHPQWSTHQAAIAERAGAAEINIMAGSQLNSLLAPSASSDAHPQLEQLGTETVRTQTLAAVMAALADEGHRPEAVLLKLDTQGYDARIFRGNLEHIRQIGLLSIEMSSQKLYDGAEDLGQFLDEVRAEGFDLSGIFPVGRDAHLRIEDMDCLFVNRRCLSG